MTQMSHIQREMLEIYNYVYDLCKKNNIKIFGIGGTELGAVRHHGFIPWDDDMDFGIPVDDYKRFVKIVQTNLPKPYKYIEIPCMGGKVYNADTTFLEVHCTEYKDNYYGVFIDIFPLVGVPDDKEEQGKFLKEMLEFHCAADIWYHYRKLSDYSKKEIFDWRSSLMNRCDIKKVKNVAEFSLSHFFVRKASGFLSDPELLIPFENTIMPISTDYDKDLTAHYGDYMVLPPKEKQMRHEDFGFVDLERPSDHYYSLIKKTDEKLHDLLSKKHLYEGEMSKNLNSLNLEKTELFARLREREKTIKQLQQEKDDLNTVIDKIMNSRSYKAGLTITKPYSVARKIANGLFDKKK